MEDILNNFIKQLKWTPTIENENNLQRSGCIIVAGMGGSNLSAELIRARDPFFDITTHRDYGLPALSDEVLRDSLIIASSYSGNTEETISAFEECVKRGFNCAVITTGGRLLELARKNNTPYVVIPTDALQPRFAVGYNLKALINIVGDKDAERELEEAANMINTNDCELKGKNIAEELKGKIPVVCSSVRNKGIVYNWKVRLNETAKIPAFCNVFSEFNHNEMEGFDFNPSSKILSDKFHFIFLKDGHDSEKIQKRMEITDNILKDKGFGVDMVMSESESDFGRILSYILIADWTSVFLARHYESEPGKVEMIERLKDMMAQE